MDGYLIPAVLVAFAAGLAAGAGLLSLVVRLDTFEKRLAELERRNGRLPNWLIEATDGLSAQNADVLLWLRDVITVVEGRVQDSNRLLGQIRNGEYHRDQPAAPRRGGNHKGKA